MIDDFYELPLEKPEMLESRGDFEFQTDLPEASAVTSIPMQATRPVLPSPLPSISTSKPDRKEIVKIRFLGLNIYVRQPPSTHVTS